MSTDKPAVAADPAVRAPLGDIAAGPETFTQARVERIIDVVVALGSTVLGLQAFLNALGSGHESSAWRLGLMIGVFVPLALMILACGSGVAVRQGAGLFAIVFPIALLAWPAATAGRSGDAGREPWIWYLLNVAVVAAVIAFRMPLQILWALLVPVSYATVRLIQVGARPTSTASIVLDAVFVLIVAGVLITLGWMLRSVAVGIDRARRDAVASYA
ncbi:MAG: ATP-binding protein, partial [Microbacterium sp.]